MIVKPIYIAVVSIAVFGVWSYWLYQKGVNNGQDALIAKHSLQLIELNNQAQKKVRKKQQEILDIEKAWLSEEQKTKIIYRDRVVRVKELITNSNIDECIISNDILHEINNALSSTAKNNNP